MPAKNKTGTARVITRAAGRKILPAVQPGTIEDTADGKTAFARRLYKQLHTICKSNDTAPKFSANTARLDRWLLDSIDKEKTGFLAAFIDQASMIQSNLHYRLIGAKPLVARTLDILHDSEGGEGFRRMIKATALNFYCSNFGGAVYLNRTEPVQASYLPNSNKWYWTTPPVDSMYATDPTLFQPNWDYVYPFSYDGELWTRFDFFRISSMPSTRLETWGVGRCPLWRCIQIARMTSAVYEHVFTTLSPDSAKGVLTVKGLSFEEFLAALSGSDAVNEGDETRRDGMTLDDQLGDIVVLADRDDEIIVKFVTLSRLPEGFFIDQWLRWTLTSFSVNLGYQLDEFIGSSSNKLLGQSGAEAQLGQARSGSKGGLEFSQNFQNAMQAYVIPSTVQFEFADRDVGTEIDEISLKQAKADLVISLFEANQIAIINKGDPNDDTLIEAKAGGQHIIDRTEARRMLSELGVVSWLSEQINPDIVLTDDTYDVSTHRIKRMREEFRDTKPIQKLATEPTGHPVVLYESWIDKSTGFERRAETILWDSDSDLVRPINWRGVDTSHDNVGPHDFKRARTRKPITLELVQDSQHARDILRLMRRFFSASTRYIEDGVLSVEDYQSIKQIAVQRDVENLTSKIYAICQAGRDSLIGAQKISEPSMAQIAATSLGYAKGRWSKICELIDDEAKRLIEVNLQALPLDYADSHVADMLANMDEFLKVRAGEIGGDEVDQAFATGRIIADDVVGSKTSQRGR